MKQMTRQYFLYDNEKETDSHWLLMPNEYLLYTNEYWSEKSIADRFYNATGRDPDLVWNIRLVQEILDVESI
jgi:hypothetical protein